VEPIILCSSSPTRAKLLKEAGIPFRQFAPQFNEEKIATSDGYRFVVEASYGKLKSCLEKFPNRIVVSADTIVTDGREILRKAKNREEAREILLKQSGNQIKIVTGMWVSKSGHLFGRVEETIYQFAPFDPEDLEEFLESEEWKGKAGACIVEGFCGKYIQWVKGYQSTAMGLPVEELKRILEEKEGGRGGGEKW
jgi:septum formation protein